MKGKFITFEGSEGSGKSTQINYLHKYLLSKGKRVLFVREPGGVKISEKIRLLLLDPKNKKMGPECETMLYMAARAQLVKEVIQPALMKGHIVLCDRFLDSTVAYQGYAGGVNVNFIKEVGSFVTQGAKPDLSFFFDVDAKEGLSRIKRVKDRIERKPLPYHEKIRRGYLKIAKQEPRRIKLLRGSDQKEDIRLEVKSHINRLLKIKE